MEHNHTKIQSSFRIYTIDNVTLWLLYAYKAYRHSSCVASITVIRCCLMYPTTSCKRFNPYRTPPRV